ncbi:unnamed protein product [Cunninghamella echinulata]
MEDFDFGFVDVLFGFRQNINSSSDNGYDDDYYEQAMKLYNRKELAISLSNLNELDICFCFDLEINEKILETIHQACPHLESLTIYCYFISVSNEYDALISDISFTPTNRLKKFGITYPVPRNPKIYSYFASKYPQLSALALQMTWNASNTNNNENKLLHKMAIYNMIVCFTSLNQLTLYTNYLAEDFKKDYEFNGIGHWPHDDILQWLQQHSSQLTHLHYPFALQTNNLQLTQQDHDDKNENNIQITTIQQLNKNNKNFNNMIMNIDIMKIQSQQTCLDFLSYLSLRGPIFIETIRDSLFYNKYTTVVSYSINEIKIYEDSNYSNHVVFYITDLLDVFPSLITMEAADMASIKDEDEAESDKNENDGDDIIGTEMDLSYVNNGIALHRILKQRKQILGISKKHVPYKLKKLEIKKSHLHFKYGLTGLLKKCPHVNHLLLTSNEYALYEWQPKYKNENTLFTTLRDTYFDFSHLYLEYVKIDCLIFTRWSGEWVVKNSMLVKMIVFETLSDVKYTLIAENWLKNIDGKFEQSTLQLKCKYIDNIAFGVVEKFR